MYVSYEFYTETFGTLIPEKDFPRVEAEAEAAISYLTYVNGDIFAKEDSRVKLAECSCGGGRLQQQTKQRAPAGPLV